MAALFDAYIMVDWSAASKPVTGANSIWIGILAKDARLKLQFRAVNIDTRLKAREFLEDMVGKLTKRGDRVLLGFDFSLGYPAGTAEALGLKLDGKAPWQAMHEHLACEAEGQAGQFQRPLRHCRRNELRRLERTVSVLGRPGARCRLDAGQHEARLYGRPLAGIPDRRSLSARQQAGPAEIGLAAGLYRQRRQPVPDREFPMSTRLRETWPGARIWPFEFDPAEPLTEEALTDVNVVITEIYPSLTKAKPESGETMDAAQVREIAHHYASLDEKGALSGAFSTAKTLEPAENTKIQAEEGWIPGV